MLNDADRVGLDRYLRNGGALAVEPAVTNGVLAVGATAFGAGESGSWQVEEFLGRGGSGEVYRVVHAVTRMSAAAKVLTKDDPAAAKRFWGEIAFLKEWHEAAGSAALGHPQPFPCYYESGEADGRPFVILELLEPIDMPTDEKGIAAYLIDVCSCVSALHRSGIVHRDLKPKNIMRRANGEVVLIDFGLAKDTFESPLPRTDVSVVSGKAVGVGTPGYAAPEQLIGGEVSPAADIHALGRIANSAFGGKPPSSWEQIIRRATSSIPEQRYETVDDFVKAIRNRNRVRNCIGVGVATVALMLFAGLFLWRDELPLVRDVAEQRRFDAICEKVTTNIVTRQLLWEKLETNEFGKVYWKERAFRNVTNAIDVTLVRLNRATNAFVRPLTLKAGREYWLVGPGLLDASIASEGSNTTVRLKNCVFYNRSSVSLRESGIRYVFQGGVYLNFTDMDRPSDFTLRQLDGFDGAFDRVRFRNDRMPVADLMN